MLWRARHTQMQLVYLTVDEWDSILTWNRDVQLHKIFDFCRQAGVIPLSPYDSLYCLQLLELFPVKIIVLWSYLVLVALLESSFGWFGTADLAWLGKPSHINWWCFQWEFLQVFGTLAPSCLMIEFKAIEATTNFDQYILVHLNITNLVTLMLTITIDRLYIVTMGSNKCIGSDYCGYIVTRFGIGLRWLKICPWLVSCNFT